MSAGRVLSGMRPTGKLHLGHHHGVLKNWVNLQWDHECFFFVADWHALTTHYESPAEIEQNSRDMVIDWLAAGLDPEKATLFVQSRVPEHAELHLLLSMITPLAWLERIPSYKDQREKLAERDLGTYGFLGYPLLQSADILIYRASVVPIGEDQVPHVEFTREIARRFNFLYGREPGFAERAQKTLQKIGARELFDAHQKRWLEHGDEEALSLGRELIARASGLSKDESALLSGYLENTGKTILTEPKALLTEASKMPGLDGQKMSKSYNNTISLREDADSVIKKIRTMPTDPARVRRSDPGTPEKCPVWQLHLVYSNEETKQWAHEGCTTAAIGCLDCKQPVIEAILREQKPMLERARRYEEEPELVRSILDAGCERARKAARETLKDVRAVMGLN
jgi:tryptophanyl-tRNA synthetase